MSWTLIEHQALTSSAASVTLGSGGTIPQTYKTLKLVVSARNTVADGSLFIAFNGGTTNYSWRRLLGSGSAASSFADTTNYAGVGATLSTDTASTFGSAEITIPNYAGSTNKPYSADGVNENNATTAYQMFVAGLSSNTAAITSITLTLGSSGSFAASSTITLYGLA